MANGNSMDAKPGWRSHVIQAQVDRCLAFEDHIVRLHRREYASKLPPTILDFLEGVSIHVRGRLKRLLRDPEFTALSDSEAATEIGRYLGLYQDMYQAASLVERVGGGDGLVELYMPLRRILTRALGEETDLLLLPIPSVNYSLQRVGEGLRKVAEGVDVGARTLSKLRGSIYAVGFPGLQSAHFVGQCLVAHEVGHAMYARYKLADELLPLVQKDEEGLGELARSIETAMPADMAIGKVRIKASLSAAITRAVEGWVMEIACDIVGYALLGPAFLISALHFLPLCGPLDDSTDKYPPNRMRLHLLFGLLDDSGIPYRRVRAFLKTWRDAVSFKKIEWGTPWDQLTGEAIMRVAPQISRVTLDKVKDRVGLFDYRDHVDHIHRLIERMRQGIPPNEVVRPGGPVTASFPCVMNAGWFSLLDDLGVIKRSYRWSDKEAKGKVNDWVAKAVELAEIRTRWEEVQ